jgi:hypothetical protein
MKKLVAAYTLAVGILLLATRSKAQFNPQPDPPAFGLVGISFFDTLQLNSYCAVNDVPPGPCSVRLQFSDSNGHVVNNVAATLQPGQSASLSLRGADMTRGTARMQILPAVQISGPGGVVSTLEFIDEGGRTNFIMHPIALFHGAMPQ